MSKIIPANSVKTVNEDNFLKLLNKRNLVEDDYKEIRSFLMIRDKKAINRFDIEGNTPLHVACCKEDLRLVKMLLEFEADADKRREGNISLKFIYGLDIDGSYDSPFELINKRFKDAEKKNDARKDSLEEIKDVLDYGVELSDDEEVDLGDALNSLKIGGINNVATTLKPSENSAFQEYKR